MNHSIAKHSAGRLKILAIGDLPDNLTVLRSVVAAALPEVMVLTALSGPEGISLATAEDPDVILLDTFLPGMDGFEVCRRLKSDAQLRLIPVVVTQTERASRLRAMELGADGFLTHPLDTEEVTAQIRAMAKMKSVNQTLRAEKDHLATLLAERTRQLEQEHAAHLLAAEQMKLQFSALTSAANGIVITDRNGKIEWVNPAFCRLTGYGAEEAIGSYPRLLKSGRQSPEFYATLWATVLAGQVWHGEIVNRRKDGQFYTEDMTITPVPGADGAIAHFVAIKQDVTIRRQLEIQLQQAQKMEAIGTLAGGIAHDFNNMLSAMFGFAYLLQEEIQDNLAAQEHLTEILSAINRAKDLVQQILTFSRKREQHRQVISLHGVVKDAVKFLRASLPAQINIELHLDADTPAVLADPTQIYQVAVNLATNALHAIGDRSGQLMIRLDPFLPDAAFIQAHPEFRPVEYARLKVADTGHGMDATTLAHIFEPFFTTKPVGKGTGLGLAVVYGIVQAHEGAVTVASQVGEGTTFSLYFPGRTSAAPPAEAPHAALPKGRGQKILLLDDEPALTSAQQRLLTRLNYQVTVSHRPGEALAWCREQPARFDLVITDLTMPEISGLEVARQLHELRPDLPVILTSGFNPSLTAANLRAAGIRQLLEKPASVTALAEMIWKVLG